MPPPPFSRVSVDQLVAHEPFVRTMAIRLVADPSAADDVAQEAWLKALRRPPAHDGALRAWLASVVRSTAFTAAGRVQRREARERRAGADRDTAAPDETLERKQIVEAIRAAVATLDERYRTVIELRFFCELELRDVAATLGLPVETVRTRTRRGLELLRGRLDASYAGDRQSWVRGLALLAVAGDAPRRAAGLGSVAASVAASVALVVSAWLVGSWSFGRDDFALRVAGGDPIEQVAAAGVAPTHAEGRAEASGRAALERTAAAPAEATLVVRALRGASSEPAPDLALVLERDGISEARATDERGRAVFRGSSPGEWTLVPQTGPTRTVVLRPGVQELELRLPDGRSVSGFVHLSGAPVADAEVFFTYPERPDLECGHTLSGPDGRFALEGVSTRAWVGARKPGLRPTGISFLDQALYEDPGTDVRLSFSRDGDSVAGRIVDEHGAPVAGARVGVVESRASGTKAWITGELMRDVPPLTVVSDQDGAFVLDGFPRGRHEVWTEAPDGREVTRTALAHPRPGPLTLRLPPQTTCTGRVAWPDGAPAAGAIVAVRLPRDRERRATADARGRFAVDGLPPGRIDLRAFADDGRRIGLAAEALVARPGEELTWDPVLAPGGIEGVVVDAAGAPLSGRPVRLYRHAERAPGLAERIAQARRPERRTVTDVDGHFRFVDCREGEHEVLVFESADAGFASARAAAVLPGERGLRLVAAPASGELFGTLADSSASPSPGARLYLDGPSLPCSLRIELDGESGAFRSPALPAGDYVLIVADAGRPPTDLGTVRIEPGVETDLGVRTIPPDGTIEVEVRDAAGRPVPHAVLDVRRGDQVVFAGEPLSAHVRSTGGSWTLRVPAGRWVVRARTSRLAPRARVVDVEPGEREEVELVLAPATPRQIRVELGRVPEERGVLTVVARWPNGDTVFEKERMIEAWSREHVNVRARLPLGELDVTLELSDAEPLDARAGRAPLRSEHRIHVSADAPATEPLIVRFGGASLVEGPR